jgi:hypothetical protein
MIAYAISAGRVRYEPRQWRRRPFTLASCQATDS